MLWKFNTLTEQFSLWSTLQPRNLAVESRICHYLDFCQQNGMQPVWRETSLSVTSKETSEHQIVHVDHHLPQAAEMPEFSWKWFCGTFKDQHCEALGHLFHRQNNTFRISPLHFPMMSWVWGRTWRILSLALLLVTHTLHSLLSPRSDLSLLRLSAVQCL